MAVDLTISIGNLLTIASFLIGGIWFITTMRSEIRELALMTKLRLDYLEAQAEGHKRELEKLANVLITLAAYEQRFQRIEETINDVRHGRGLVVGS